MECPQTQIVNMKLVWLGCLWRDTRDSKWEWASVTYQMLQCFYSWNIGSHKYATKIDYWERTSPIFLFFYLYFQGKIERARRASWQRWLSSVYFYSLVTFELVIPLEIVCYCEIILTVQLSSVWFCGLVESCIHAKCMRSEDYKAKKWLKLSSCLWSPMVLKSVKIWKSSRVSSRPKIKLNSAGH